MAQKDQTTVRLDQTPSRRKAIIYLSPWLVLALFASLDMSLFYSLSYAKVHHARASVTLATVGSLESGEVSIPVSSTVSVETHSEALDDEDPCAEGMCGPGVSGVITPTVTPLPNPCISDQGMCGAAVSVFPPWPTVNPCPFPDESMCPGGIGVPDIEGILEQIFNNYIAPIISSTEVIWDSLQIECFAQGIVTCLSDTAISNP